MDVNTLNSDIWFNTSNTLQLPTWQAPASGLDGLDFLDAGAPVEVCGTEIPTDKKRLGQMHGRNYRSGVNGDGNVKVHIL